MGHAVRLGAGGALEVVRRAPPEPADRLRASVGALRRAAGAGAVDVLAAEETDGALEVRLAYAGRPVGTELDGRTAARLGGAVAAHLADLQLRGVAHGAIDASHVLVGHEGAVRLTGFVPGADDHAGDVLALGRLLLEILDDDARDDRAAAVRTTAARCCADDPAARPTAAAIAAALATSREVHHAPAPRRSPRFDRRLVAAVASIVAVAVVAALAWPREPSADARAITTTTTTWSTSTTIAAARVWPRPTTTMIHDGARWQFDREGLAALVGNFGCTGTRAALLDEEGRLWVAPAWEDGTSAVLVATIDSAVDAEVVQTDRCDAVRVLTTYGTFRTIAV